MFVRMGYLLTGIPLISSAHFPDPPNVVSLSPEFLQRLRGQFAVFSCVVTGLPAPLVRWTRNNSFGVVDITQSRFKHSIQESNQTTVDGPDIVSSTLTIGNLSNMDDGQYTCRGIDTFNTVNLINARESAVVDLSVFGKGIFVLRIIPFIVVCDEFVLLFSSSPSDCSQRHK